MLAGIAAGSVGTAAMKLSGPLELLRRARAMESVMKVRVAKQVVHTRSGFLDDDSMSDLEVQGSQKTLPHDLA
jgi:hypothetical protein